MSSDLFSAMAEMVDDEPWDGDTFLRDLTRLQYNTKIRSLSEFPDWTPVKLAELERMLDGLKPADRVEHLDVLYESERPPDDPTADTDDPEAEIRAAFRSFSLKLIPTYEKLADEMVRWDGWCPSTVKLVYDAVGLTGLHYAKCRFGNEDILKRVDHKACVDGLECKALNVDPDNYKQTHAVFCETMQDRCRQVTVDLEKVVSIIKTGGIPLVKIPPFQELIGTRFWKGKSLDIVDSRDGHEYTAISHVWAHGLGSPPAKSGQANTVPSCRLSELQLAVNNMDTVSYRSHHDQYYGARRGQIPSKDGSKYLWLDSLCIPVADQYKDARKQAISNIAAVFNGSQHILVIDEKLSKIHEGSPKAEIALGLLCSDWVRRLWTLQEAVLGSNPGPYNRVCFKLEGRTVALDNIWQVNRGTSPPYGRAAIEWLLGTLTMVTSTNGPTGLDGWCKQWLNVTKALEYRSLSHDADETICLGACLEADISNIVSSESRIKAMLLATSLVPSSILFCDGQRIGIPPCSWAPKTFRTVGGNSRHQTFAKGGPGIATVDDTGLQGVYSGIKLQKITSDGKLFLRDLKSEDLYGPVLDWDRILSALRDDKHIKDVCSRTQSHYFKNDKQLLDAFESERKKLSQSENDDWVAECYSQMRRTRVSNEPVREQENTLDADAVLFATKLGSPYKSLFDGRRLAEVTSTAWEAASSDPTRGWSYYRTRLGTYDQLALLFNSFLPDQAVLVAVDPKRETEGDIEKELHASFLCQVRLVWQHRTRLARLPDEDVVAWEALPAHQAWCIM